MRIPRFPSRVRVTKAGPRPTSQPIARPGRDAGSAPVLPREGVLVLGGYGLRIAVERGHLRVEDGIGADRRRGRLSRATPGLTRLVVLGHTGVITLDALRWLHDIGAAFVQIDADGQVIAAAGRIGLDDARLRRAQALATENRVGLEIAKTLVQRKLAGQAEVLERLLDTAEAASQVRAAETAARSATTIDGLRLVEAQGAVTYWQAWHRLPVRFARQDEPRVPAHWRTFGSRSSLLTGRSHRATNPANALLNYLYAILEAEARLAALAVGCDPGLGVLHADQPRRDSLACDLMEPIRPAVDAFALDLLRTRTFRWQDFFETREGVCRILAPLTPLLIETAPRWAKAVAPIAEQVAQALVGSKRTPHAASRSQLATSPRPRRPLPTPLTQANRSAGRAAVRRKPPRDAPSPHATGTPALVTGLPRTCETCGALLRSKVAAYCAACRPKPTAENAAPAQAALRRARAAGVEPTMVGEAAQKRRVKARQHNRAIRAWGGQHPTEADHANFRAACLPRLQQLPASALARATGLSYTYCWLVRRGQYVPHPRHWAALTALLDQARPG